MKALPVMFAFWLTLFAAAPLVPFWAAGGVGLTMFLVLHALSFTSETRYLRAWRRTDPRAARATPKSNLPRFGLTAVQRRRLLRRGSDDAELDRLRRAALRWTDLRSSFLFGLVLAGGVWLVITLV